jgi:DNA-binding transcriptional regulator YiaG
MSDLLGIPKRSIENWEGGKRQCPEWAERLIVEKLLSIAEQAPGDK